ncbi:lipid kinase [Arsukibacterium sp.]|uniref:lipid kinase n=1 Tax=Arsukibacterium sp. TaxID=1977258 RepID=UPI00299D53E4|nr:lipid kinase [Arsukibacterium sp.]MDX1678276.1 lipid kinase [Arsukibacterium sp.]
MPYALLLVNPNSRNAQSPELDDAIGLLKTEFALSVHVTESPEDMMAKIVDYQRQDGTVIIAGGDGTISSVLKTLYQQQCTVAILPLGTANDFARSLGIPQDIIAATKTIIAGRRERIDLATVNDNYFGNVAHIGLGVDVTRQLTPETKKHFGIFAYLGAFLSAIKRNRSFRANIRADNWHCSVNVIHLAVGNGRYYGGGNIVAEQATLQDGQLNVFWIKPQPWWQLLLLGPGLRSGNLQNAQRVSCKIARNISITTTRSIELEADGELKTKTPAVFSVIPKAIEVICGTIPQPTTNRI